MIDLLQHTIGICGDTHSHIDLMDLLSFSSAEFQTYRHYFKNILQKVCRFLKNIVYLQSK